MADPKTPSLFDRFKANVLKVNQLNAQGQQLQQRLAAIQQEGEQTTGAINLLLEMDPTLPDQFNKEQEAAAKKAAEAPAKS